jgi:hypothetical protein
MLKPCQIITCCIYRIIFLRRSYNFVGNNNFVADSEISFKAEKTEIDLSVFSFFLDYTHYCHYDHKESRHNINNISVFSTSKHIEKFIVINNISPAENKKI